MSAINFDVDIGIVRGTFRLEVAFLQSAQALGVFGPSGAGKTTLVNAIAGLDRPDRGYIRIGDATLFDSATGVDLPPEQRRIGYVFQDGRLFPHLTVLENLRYGLRRRGRRAKLASVDDVAGLLGLGQLLARAPVGLSGGEKQRVALGRALLSAPRLLLLDEPLASLDMQRRAEILPYLDRLRGQFGLPMLYVSHDPVELRRICDSAILLEEGRLAGNGVAAELLPARHPLAL